MLRVLFHGGRVFCFTRLGRTERSAEPKTGLRGGRSRKEGEVGRRSHAATGAAMALPESWGSKRRAALQKQGLRITGLWLGGDEKKSLSRS